MKKTFLLLPLVFILFLIFGIWSLRLILIHFLGFQENSIYLNPVAVVLACFLASVAEGSFILLEERRMQKATQSAIQFLTAKGMEIESRVHPITYIDTEPKYYEEDAEPSYALRYRYPQACAWALHKTRSGRGDFSNGWRLIVKDGEIPPKINAVLETIANDPTWSKNSLELGSDSEKVWAFWNDGYGGLQIAEKVFKVLNQIVESGES
jgi:hypothetical protein